jgi:Mce-associated membrane protein
MAISGTQEDHDYQSKRKGVGMVIDDLGVHRTAEEAAMNGGSGSSENTLEKPKGKPSKKSKPKSAKKSGRMGAPPNSVSDGQRHSPDASEAIEFVSPPVNPAPIGRLSDEPEVHVGGENVGGSSTTIDVDEFEVDEVELNEPVQQESVEAEAASELSGTNAEPSTIENDTRSTAEPLPSRRQRWMHSKGLLLSAGALIVALAVGLALTLSALGNQNALASSRTSALSAARTYAVQLASYNYRDLHRDFSTVAANSTPSFRRTFAESSNALKSTLSKYKATAVASVESAGVVSASTSRAVVLVFLDQKIANSTQTKPTTDRSQVKITVVKSGGRWLVDQVTLL